MRQSTPSIASTASISSSTSSSAASRLVFIFQLPAINGVRPSRWRPTELTGITIVASLLQCSVLSAQ